jgi:hypothetical protein
VQRGRDGRIGHVRLAVELLEELGDAVHGRTPPERGHKPRVQAGVKRLAADGLVGIRDAAR